MSLDTFQYKKKKREKKRAGEIKFLKYQFFTRTNFTGNTVNHTSLDSLMSNSS